jgi:hypothetical protein
MKRLRDAQVNCVSQPDSTGFGTLWLSGHETVTGQAS